MTLPSTGYALRWIPEPPKPEGVQVRIIHPEPARPRRVPASVPDFNVLAGLDGEPRLYAMIASRRWASSRSASAATARSPPTPGSASSPSPRSSAWSRCWRRPRRRRRVPGGAAGPVPEDFARLEALLRKVVREELAGLDRRTDARLEAFLQACHAYSLSSWWTCGELIADARRDRRRDLLMAIERITGAADPARSLGRFLQRHADGEAAGLRLEHAARVWRVVSTVSHR